MALTTLSKRQIARKGLVNPGGKAMSKRQLAKRGYVMKTPTPKAPAPKAPTSFKPTPPGPSAPIVQPVRPSGEDRNTFEWDPEEAVRVERERIEIERSRM